MTDAARSGPDPDRRRPRAPRPSLGHTIVRLAAVSVTAVALVWSALTVKALADRHAAATATRPARSAPAAPAPTAQPAAPAPVTTTTS